MQTDTNRWARVAASPPRISWLDRSEAAAHLIRPGDTVCDLGAGAQTLRRFLPPSVGYIPVDCVKTHPDTWVADLNGPFELPDRPFNVITAIGVFSHLDDLDAFFERLVTTQKGKFLICSAEHGTEDQWLAYLSRRLEGAALFARLDYLWIAHGRIGGTTEPSDALRPVDALTASYMSIRCFAGHKVDLAKRRLRRGGNNGHWTD